MFFVPVIQINTILLWLNVLPETGQLEKEIFSGHTSAFVMQKGSKWGEYNYGKHSYNYAHYQRASHFAGVIWRKRDIIIIGYCCEGTLDWGKMHQKAGAIF